MKRPTKKDLRLVEECSSAMEAEIRKVFKKARTKATPARVSAFAKVAIVALQLRVNADYKDILRIAKTLPDWRPAR